MSIIFLSVLCVICVFSMFSFTYRVNGVNRTIIEAPKGIFETSIPLAEDNIDLYFEKEKVKKQYQEYLDRTLVKYANSYDISYRFYNLNDYGACDIKECRGVEIYIDIKVLEFYTLHRVTYYEIKETSHE